MIVVAGEALIDLVAEGADGVYRAVVGGSPANVAVTLARLEQPVTLLARIGADAFGQRIRAHLAANGVDLTRAVAAAEPTSLAIASLSASGSATYDFYLDGTADWQWSAAELPPSLEPPVRTLHCGSLALALPPGAARLEEMLAREHAAARVTVSIDLNLRPSIVADPDAERARVERQIRYAHVVKASDEDLAWLYPGVAVDEIAASWRASGVTAVVVTLGAKGSYLLAPNGVAHHQTARPVEVVDTVGAGDSFTGGMLAALARIDATGSDPVGRLAAVTPQQWLAVLDHAGAVAAVTCTRRGADPPRLSELDQR